MKNKLFCWATIIVVLMSMFSFCDDDENDEEDVKENDSYNFYILHNYNPSDSFSAVKNKGIEDVSEYDYTTCLNFTALENGCEIGFSENNDYSLNVEYSLAPNKPKSWNSIKAGQTVTLDVGKTIYFRGSNSGTKTIEIFYKGRMKIDGYFNLLF